MLIVDDEPMIGTTLRVLLQGEHEVVVACSGSEARDVLTRDAAFDIILCDLMMPGLSGMDLHGWLLARDAAAAGRVVFMTGGVFTEAARDFLDRVPNHRIDKPFDPEDLLALVGDDPPGDEGPPSQP